MHLHRTLRSRLARSAVSAILAVSVCAVGEISTWSKVAGADGDTGVHTADKWYWFCAHSSIATVTDQQRVQAGMSYLDDRTDVVQIPETCAGSTDTMFLYNNYLTNSLGDPIFGGTVPFNCSSAGNCQFWVGINPSLISSYAGGWNSTFEYNINKTIRHEIGHTVGVDHDGWLNHAPCPTMLSDAMVSGTVWPGSGWLYYQYWSYNDHHKCQIDGRY